jgi:tetratricopeptide (TPR) repeat protein
MPPSGISCASSRQAVEYNRFGEIAMPASRAVNITGLVLVSFLLLALHAAFAQRRDGEAALIEQVVQLIKQNRYSEATILAKQILEAREKMLGADNPDVADALHNLAWLYRAQNRFDDAEPLYKRSLAIFERVHDYPNVASVASDLAAVYMPQGRYADAEPLYKRALAIRETNLGPDHPDVAAVLNNLAKLYTAQRRFADAEPLFKNAHWRSGKKRSVQIMPKWLIR